MISTSQKEHLTYTLILQVAILLGVVIVAWTYIFPGISKINAQQALTQESIEKYNTMKDSGISIDILGTKLAEIEWKEELLKLVRASPTETSVVINKGSSSSDYISWLNSAIAGSTEDKKKLEQAKKKINSILPTMSPISNTVDEEYITLKEYIKFIESEFLKKFDIQSNMVLWIQWVSYDATQWNVGTFDLRLEFKATNANIQNLITYVNKSWDPSILSFSGLLTDDKIPQILSNPLMTVEALALENVLDTTKPDAANSWRITIRFYVRGGSTEDIKFLKDAIILRKTNLQKDIDNALSEYKAQWSIGSEFERLEVFAKKYAEFTQSLESVKWIDTTDITILGQTATSLKGLSDEFLQITNKK